MIKGIGLNMISLVGNRNSVTNICNIYTEAMVSISNFVIYNEKVK
jgi:hypothetical protein